MGMVEVKTSELIGPALDWAVAKSVPQKHWPVIVGGKVMLDNDYDHLPYSPSTDWEHGGPLIEKFIIALKFCVFELPNESWKAETHESWANGSTALVASMRAIVDANFGDTVSVPRELMQ